VTINAPYTISVITTEESKTNKQMQNVNSISELTLHELEQVNGGNPAIIAPAVALMVYLMNNWSDFKDGIVDGIQSSL